MGSSESGTQTQASDSKAHILNHSSLMSVKHHKKSPSYLSAFMFSSTLAKICHPLYMTSLETLTFSKKKKRKKKNPSSFQLKILLYSLHSVKSSPISTRHLKSRRIQPPFPAFVLSKYFVLQYKQLVLVIFCHSTLAESNLIL